MDPVAQYLPCGEVQATGAAVAPAQYEPAMQATPVADVAPSEQYLPGAPVQAAQCMSMQDP